MQHWLTDVDGAALPIESLEVILGGTKGMLFSTKDVSLRYTGANEAMLKACGVKSTEDLCGLSSADVFAPECCRRLEAQDRDVIDAGRPMYDRLHLMAPISGAAFWALVSRWPVFESGVMTGIVILVRPLPGSTNRQIMYRRLLQVVDHVEAELDQEHEVAALAAMLGVTAKQLERSFLNLFGVPPRRYLTRVKMEAAAGLLRANMSVAEVAGACGYADPSAFTRRFRSVIGQSPKEYRDVWRAQRSISATGPSDVSSKSGN